MIIDDFALLALFCILGAIGLKQVVSSRRAIAIANTRASLVKRLTILADEPVLKSHRTMLNEAIGQIQRLPDKCLATRGIASAIDAIEEGVRGDRMFLDIGLEHLPERLRAALPTPASLVPPIASSATEDIQRILQISRLVDSEHDEPGDVHFLRACVDEHLPHTIAAWKAALALETPDATPTAIAQIAMLRQHAEAALERSSARSARALEANGAFIKAIAEKPESQ